MLRWLSQGKKRDSNTLIKQGRLKWKQTIIEMDLWFFREGFRFYYDRDGFAFIQRNRFCFVILMLFF